MKFSDYEINKKKYTIKAEAEQISIYEVTSNNELVESAMSNFIKDIESFRLLHNKLLTEKTTITNRKKYVVAVDIFLKIFLIGFVYKKFSNKVKELTSYMNTLMDLENKCRIELKHELHDNYKKQQKILLNAFQKMAQSDSVWDITNQSMHDGVSDRSGVSFVTERSEAFFEKSHLWYIDSDIESMFFYNVNGHDFFIYPTFMITDSEKKFKYVSIPNLNITCYSTKFLESESIPNDTEIVGYTWKYVNKNGSQDKRFNDNEQIAVAKYAELKITVTKMNFKETYLISNYKNTDLFVKEFEKYQAIFN